jgi:hypothetical protein
VKGKHAYFEDPDLLKRVLKELKDLPLAKQRRERAQERKEKIERWLSEKRWSIKHEETNKLLNSLRDGQFIMIYSWGLYRLAMVDRSPRGSLCIRKYDNKRKCWANRRVPLRVDAHLRNLKNVQAVSYMESRKWPRRQDLPRTNASLVRRINKRIKTATSYLSVGRLRQKYGR